MPCRPRLAAAQSSGSHSPLMRVASSPAMRKVRAARATSPRASRIGLPDSRLNRVLSSSASRSMRAATWASTSRRSKLAMRFVRSKASTAATVARSSSSAPAWKVDPTSDPSAGLRTSSAFAVSTNSPAR
jgi:hypothetical protein